MLPANQAFSSGAMNPTPGMAMSPLLQGFGAGENMQDQFTNTALNQQSQDIQNQQQQNILNQSLLDNPNLAAQRQLTGSSIGTQQSMYDNGQQAAVQGGALSAKVQQQIADMSTAQQTTVMNHSQAYLQAAGQIKQDPSSMIPGTDANKSVASTLKDAGIKDVPDVLDSSHMNDIMTRAAVAPDTIQHIQQMQAGAQKGQIEQSVEAQRATSAEKIAAGAQTTEIEKANIMVQNQKTMENVAAKLLQKYENDPSSVNSDQIATVQNQLIKTLGPLQWNTLYAKITAAQNLKDTPEQAVQRQQRLLMAASPQYALLEVARLKKIADEGKAASTGTPAPAAGGQASGAAPVAPPKSGDVVQGYKFNGGDPSDKNNWTKQ